MPPLMSGNEMAINPLKNYPGYALRRASSASLSQLAHRLAPLGLRLGEASVLRVIQANPGIKQSEIGRMLDIVSANMTPLVRKLSKQGWVLREHVDGRSQALRLSETGKRLTARVTQAMTEHEASLMARIPSELRIDFIKALTALTQDFNE